MTSASSLPPAVLADVQGNVYPGFKKPHQAYLFVRFPAAPVGTAAIPPAQAARNWLAELKGSIARADEVLAFNTLYKIVNGHRPRRAAEAVRATWVNVGFTYLGLSKMAPASASLANVPDDLKQGLYARAFSQAGDAPETDRAGWLVGATAADEADAILIVAADLQTDLDAELARQYCVLAKHGLSWLVRFDGAALGNGHEHFGFFDHATDPIPVMAPDAAVQDGVLAGELLLGLPRYPRAAGAANEISPVPHPWMANGSYLVVRRLRQYVGRFRDRAVSAANELNALGTLDDGPVSADLFEAKCMGRWPNGVPLGLGTGPVAPPDGPPGPLVIPDNYYASDPTGRQIPRFAHIRKVHPRAPEETHPERYRLFRRGITYGPELPRGAAEDHADRGIIFVAYQASLSGQFEFIMSAWANRSTFPQLTSMFTPQDTSERWAGEDPILGRSADGDHSADRTLQYRVRVDPQGGALADVVTTCGITLAQFVTMTGGGYFFTPGIAGLDTLAGV